MEEHPDEPLNVGPRSPGLTLAQIQAQQQQQQVNHHQQQQQQQQHQQIQLQISQPQSQSQSPIKFENKLTIDQDRLAELREKPLTLHNMKSAVATSAKTEALIASLGLKPNSIDFKQKLTKNKLITKKPLKKRLKDLQPLGTAGSQSLKDIKAAKLLAKYQKQQQQQQSNDSIKKISKATLKNNQLILSSINARKQIEERQNSQIQDVHNKFLFKKCRYFKCSECKLIFVDSLQLHHHQSHSINCSKQIKVVHDDNPTKLANLSAFIDQQKRFQCSFCKNIYLNKFSFLSHVLTCNVVNNLL